MRLLAQLAVLFVVGTDAIARAQVTSPDALIAPAPKPPAQRQAPMVATTNGDLQWLWAFAKPEPLGSADDLRMDARFQALLKDEFRQPQAMWGTADHAPSLAAVIPMFLTKYGAVTKEDDRVLTVDGCVPTFCAAHGMLWIDLGAKHPLLVFAAVNWNAEAHATDEAAAEYTLWLFASRELSADALPAALTAALGHWDARLAAAHRGVPHIREALLVEPDGTPHALDPQLAGANTLPPQPDTLTPKDAEGR